MKIFISYSIINKYTLFIVGGFMLSRGFGSLPK
jgi:uncharacterized membrane protein